MFLNIASFGLSHKCVCSSTRVGECEVKCGAEKMRHNGRDSERFGMGGTVVG